MGGAAAGAGTGGMVSVEPEEEVKVEEEPMRVLGVGSCELDSPRLRVGVRPLLLRVVAGDVRVRVRVGGGESEREASRGRVRATRRRLEMGSPQTSAPSQGAWVDAVPEGICSRPQPLIPKAVL